VHKHNIRDIATEKQLEQLNMIQKANSKYINDNISFENRKVKLKEMFEIMNI
jgi:hypothetical protein